MYPHALLQHFGCSSGDGHAELQARWSAGGGGAGANERARELRNHARALRRFGFDANSVQFVFRGG